MHPLVAQSLAPLPMPLGTVPETADQDDARRLWRPYACAFPGCHARWRFRSEMTRHLRIHTRERPFVCPFEGCTKAFTQKFALQSHLHSHTGTSPFACFWGDCTKRFTHKQYLQRHLHAHTGRKAFVCCHNECGQAFVESAALREHQRVHTGQRPFVCRREDCRQAFAQSSTLRAHLRIHSGSRPYACVFEGCEKAFRQQSTLQSHLSCHTRAKPYSCSWPLCNKRFAQRYYLTKHLHTHRGDTACRGGHNQGRQNTGRPFALPPQPLCHSRQGPQGPGASFGGAAQAVHALAPHRPPDRLVADRPDLFVADSLYTRSPAPVAQPITTARNTARLADDSLGHDADPSCWTPERQEAAWKRIQACLEEVDEAFWQGLMAPSAREQHQPSWPHWPPP